MALFSRLNGDAAPARPSARLGFKLPSLTPPAATTRAMRLFWWEALAGEISEIVWFQYFVVYALTLGASAGLIGGLTAAGSLVSALAMWPGAFLAERTRHYKLIIALSSGGVARICFLVLALAPWFSHGTASLVLLAAVAIVRGFMISVPVPAWHAFAAGTVPAPQRNRYFASRNSGRQLMSLAGTPLVGLVVSELGGAGGWQFLWVMAFAFGALATLLLLKTPAPAVSFIEPQNPKAHPPVRGALKDRDLLAFVTTTSLYQLTVAVAAPFFSVYLVQQMHASPFWVGVTATASPLSGMLLQPVVARLADRLGARSLLVLSNALIPVIPFAWLLVDHPYQVVGINLVGGALWAGNQLANFNLLLETAPAERLPSYTAAQQSGLFVAGFVGPLAGGLLVQLGGFEVLFFLSAVGRIVCAALQYRLLPGRAKTLRVKQPLSLRALSPLRRTA